MKNDTFNTNETYVSPIVGIAQVVGNIYKPYTGTYARVYLNGSKIFEQRLSEGSSSINKSFTVRKGDQITYVEEGGGGGQINRNVSIKTKDIYLQKEEFPPLYPVKIIGLGIQTIFPFFGQLKGKWIGGGRIDTKKESTTALTGDIPAGNYQKYISIFGEDGKRYKIGVYGD